MVICDNIGSGTRGHRPQHSINNPPEEEDDLNSEIQANTRITWLEWPRIAFFGFINFIFGTVVISGRNRKLSLTSRDVT